MEVTFRSDQEYYYQNGGKRRKQISYILRLNFLEYLPTLPKFLQNFETIVVYFLYIMNR